MRVRAGSFLSGLLMLGTVAYCAVSRGDPVCHIHPPVTEGSPPPPIVGPYPSGEACERANATMYGGQGRCHCAFDSGVLGGRPFQPKQVPRSPEDPAFDLPSGR